MGLINVHSYYAGQWTAADDGARAIANAVTGEPLAIAGQAALDTQSMVDFARTKGGPALRAMSFHDRARMLKALALELSKFKDELYSLSHTTGATTPDAMIDIDGGIGTMLVYASKGRREMPDGDIYVDGELEMLSRNGTFVGQHVATSLHGVAIHINAFNFPVWGMLEKLAPTLLAGMPAIVKPATATCHVTEQSVRRMIESGILPDGALQLVSGGLGDLLDRLDYQDVVGFTGSAKTALMLRSNPILLEKSVRFVAEQDSLNASVLGPDVTVASPEFDILVKEAVREITAKAGQKCTAIRRIIVPEALLGPLGEAIAEKLGKIRIGDPALETTRMGALASAAQKADVLDKARQIAAECRVLTGDPDAFEVDGADRTKGAFVPPMLFACDDPDTANAVHSVEAFGPVATLMPYRNLAHAGQLMNRGRGSLVASVITHDPAVARTLLIDAGASHGRIYVNNRDSEHEATGHGSPLPHMVHGGPGRAGGGEELGGIRGVMHYMQRTAIQGSPDIISGITGTWIKGAAKPKSSVHPFTRSFDDLAIGDTIEAGPRTVTLEDIETFAHFTGDTFYAHMDEEAAKANPFFPGRVAHGYLLLSFAAGLFVSPDPGPVLANTGLDGLKFMKPVSPSDAISVALTVKRKTRRTDEYGEVRWHVAVLNQDGDDVAEYELHTMNEYG
ncbi:phenylacetic acid degradation bifunctional protein PaaZ [Hoeflea sp. G2-23]|uniref:Phenylacetic acid degradation bifunctional protein PaaZ n=1 Tax=Hoeflea algicola TaxID=2983763 RepID=A0ABT3Z705_9HYPH|nr:phenylacetic acid degradation bifunctional protein PaaZ [Hoeflea algicola]MCY0147527.1 phenylacetic acid degradation bifunctional protein PaaZ [Hoeflea algicola]